jgi:hypothetical protein
LQARQHSQEQEEAEANAFDLMMRRTAVRDTRVVECNDRVNYRWIPGKGLVNIDTPITIH